MFVYVRYIALLCVLLGSAAAVLLSGMFASKAEDELYQSRFARHTVIAQSIASGLWRSYAPLEQRTIQTNYGTLPIPVETAKFPDDAKRFLAQFTDEHITLYAFKGSEPYKLASNEVGGWLKRGGDPIPLGDMSTIAQGRVINDAINGQTAAGEPVNLLHSVIAIPRANASGEQVMSCVKQSGMHCAPEVFVDVTSDMTQGLSGINRQRWIFVAAATGLFALVGGVLLFTVNRAESIIARQHEVNLELTAAASAAEAQSRDKSMFLANISHELRTPLNAIIGFSEIIKSEGRNSLMPEHQNYIEDIHASGKHLLALINDILDYSKAEAGKLQLEYSEADLLKLVRNSMRMVMPRAEESQVTLVENLPKEAIVVTTDVKKLKQVLLNLLSNAVKFTPAGGEVCIAAWEDIVTRDMVLEVKDSGIGIAPKDISKVMMPFVQVDSTLARRFEGTGLGLPLSKKYIEAMGGQFYIESEVNKGTSITIRLPLKPTYGAPADAENAPDAAA